MVLIMKKYICLILVGLLMFNNSLYCYAYDNQMQNTMSDCNYEVIFDEGDTKIIFYIDSDGNETFLQLVDGIVDQKNTLLKNKNGLIKREIYSKSLKNKCDIDYIAINIYVQVMKKK